MRRKAKGQSKETYYNNYYIVNFALLLVANLYIISDNPLVSFI